MRIQLLCLIVASPLLGRWADRVGITWLLAGCLAAAALALAAFGLLPFSLPAVAACFLLIGGGAGAALSLVSTAIVQVAGRTGAGSGAALGGLRVGQQLGPALGPALAGVVFAHAGKAPAYLLLAALLAIGVALAIPATKSSHLSTDAPINAL